MQDGAGWSHAVRTLHDRADDPDRTRCSGKGDIRVRRIGSVPDCAETPARCRRMRRKDGQDARRTVHRGSDGQGDNGGADVREAQVRRTGGVRVHGARRMEPAGRDHVLVCHAGHAAQGIPLQDHVRLQSPLDHDRGSGTPYTLRYDESQEPAE